MPPPVPLIRRATPADLDALVALEEATFDCDRISRRQWRYHLDNGRATVLVACDGGRVAAAALTLRRAGSRNARLYSIAVGAAARGTGVGGKLLAAIEVDASAHDCTAMHLEVRVDNPVAIHLYERHGYRREARLAGFYEDGADAWRYAKLLHPPVSTPAR